MLKFSIMLLVGFGMVYTSLCLFVFFNQKSLIFFPSRVMKSFPKDSNLSEVKLSTEDGFSLEGWYVDNQSQKTILFFHGNGGNISYNQERITLFQMLGFNALMFDYRGYGKSEGAIEKEGDIYADGEAAYQYVLSRGIKPENIIIWGQSLGSAVAIHTAKGKPLSKIIIESAFTSMDSMAGEQYWFLPTRLLLQFHFRNIDTIQDIISPVLIIHSRDDEIIAFQNGKTLFESASNPKQFLETRGSHNTGFIQSYSLYEKSVVKFLNK